MKRIIPSMMVCLLLLLSCQQSNDEPMHLKTKSDFYSDNLSQSWSDGEAQIGVYMVLHDDLLSDAAVVNNVKNVPCDVTIEGERTFLIPADEGYEIYYPLNGAHVDLYAYLPYREQLVDAKVPLEVMAQSEVASFDIVRAKVSDKWSADAEANFLFEHCLGKLSLSITNGYNVELEDLVGMEVVIENMQATGVLHLATMEVALADEKDEVPMVVNEEGTAAHAVLLPQSSEEIRVAFKLQNGDIYYWKPNLLTLEQGIEAHYDIVVKEKDVEALSNDIKDWRFGDEGEIIAN